jgi:hypothetical protein
VIWLKFLIVIHLSQPLVLPMVGADARGGLGASFDFIVAALMPLDMLMLVT